MTGEKIVYNVFGYKVLKEDSPFGYDNQDGKIIINSVEAEIIKYTIENQIDLTAELKELPNHWIQYLEMKDNEYKKQGSQIF